MITAQLVEQNALILLLVHVASMLQLHQLLSGPTPTKYETAII